MDINYKLIKHSSKGYQEHFEKECQRIEDLRNTNRDVARLMFRQGLLQK